MKRSIKIFLFHVGKIFGLLFNRKIRQLLSSSYNGLYSGVLSAELKSVGLNFSVEKPLKLHTPNCIIIGDYFEAKSGCRIEAYSLHNQVYFSPIIRIGNNVALNNNCHIGCINSVTIGNGVLMGSNVFITDHFHGDTSLATLEIKPSERKLFSKGPVIIEDNVWIGEGVAIMPNVTIGANSIIGANSVVTKSFPSNSIIVGVPARKIN